MNLTKAIGKMFGAQLVSSGSNFLGLVIFARLIGAHELGVYFLFQAVVSILLIPADFGMRGALEKRISEDQNAGEYLATMLMLKTIPICIIVVGVLLFQRWINSYIGMEIAFWVIVAIVVNEAYYTVKYLLRGELRVGVSADMMAIREGLWLVLGVLAIWALEVKAMGLVYAYVLSAIISCTYGVLRRDTSLAAPTLKAARSLLDYAKFEVIAGTGAKLFSWLDILIIGFFLTEAAVGAYETAWRLSAAAVMVGMAIRVSIFPQFSNWSAAGDIEQISNTLKSMIIASLFLVIPALVGVLVFSTELLSLLFGEEFAVASVALILLMFHRISEGLNQTIGRTLQAVDQPDLAAYGTIIGIGMNVALNVSLVYTFGIEGAAIATLVSFASMTAIRAKYLSNFVPIRLPTAEIGWCVAAAGVMGGILYGIKNVHGVSHLYELLALVALGAIVYFTGVLFSRSLRVQLLNGVRGAIR